jgi:hypothetical protein
MFTLSYTLTNLSMGVFRYKIRKTQFVPDYIVFAHFLRALSCRIFPATPNSFDEDVSTSVVTMITRFQTWRWCSSHLTSFCTAMLVL